VLRSGRVNYWTGEHGRRFEEEFAARCACRHDVAVANGTIALELALHALGIGPGDEVVVPCRTFVASASSVVRSGARPVFADVDRDSQTLTAETIRPVMSPRTRAVVAVHLAGWPCDMDPILEVTRTCGVPVIEDCAQSHGASYKGQPVGSLGSIAAYSFCQDKIMTTGGEGGMVVTNDERLWQRVWSYKDHGKEYDAVYNRNHAPGFRWLHESIGSNGRLTEMQSSIGRIALAKLPRWVARRRALAAILPEQLSVVPALRITTPPDHVIHSYYKYYLFVKPERLKEGWNRDRILKAITAEGVPCGSGSCGEIYLEQALVDLRPPQRLPVAMELAETSLMFFVHPTLRRTDMHDICRAVKKVMAVASVY
jgi:dTDP-4-amino-4,6-dideoxygalactose transaminase